MPGAIPKGKEVTENLFNSWSRSTKQDGEEMKGKTKKRGKKLTTQPMTDRNLRRIMVVKACRTRHVMMMKPASLSL